MDINLAAAIRRARESKGLGRGTTAKRAGIPEDTLKQIERGKTGASLPMLEKIAKAIGIQLNDLLKDTGNATDQEPTPDEYHAETKPPGKESESKPIELPRRANKSEWNPELSPEYWILIGDSASAKDQWKDALENYERAEKLTLQKDYTWARLALERSGQMLINLDAFEKLEQKIDLVEQEYQQDFREKYGEKDQRIRMLIEEKRAWKETWTGNAKLAENHAREAYRLAQDLGDEQRVEATGLHFAGRAISELATTYMLYDPSLTIDAATYTRLQEAANLLARAGEMENREFSKAFNAQWEARARRAQGQSQRYDARKLDRYWRQVFAENEAAAEAKLDQAKLILIEEDDLRHALVDAEDILKEIVEPFKKWQYAPGLAEVATTQAYINLRGRRYKTPQERHQATDLCVAALYLHPYPYYPNYKVGEKLLSLFVKNMENLEYQDYEENLKTRLAEKGGVFDLLRYTFSSDDDFIENVLPLLRLLRHRSV